MYPMAQPEFRPAAYPDLPLGMKYKDEDSSLHPKLFFLFVCLFALAMLVMIPIWNNCMIIHNPILNYLIGEQVPIWFIVLTLSTIVIYTFIGILVFRYAGPEIRTMQTLNMIAMSLATLLGVLFVLFANPLKYKALQAATAVESNCRFDAKFAPLSSSYQALNALRVREPCASMYSVVACDGFRETPYTKLLRQLETQYSCAGFCAVQNVTTDTSGMMVFGAFPPTLFSEANFDISCDSALSRQLQYSVADVAKQIYGLGLALVCAAIVAGVLQLIGFCLPLYSKRKQMPEAPNYGTVPYQ